MVLGQGEQALLDRPDVVEALQVALAAAHAHRAAGEEAGAVGLLVEGGEQQRRPGRRPPRGRRRGPARAAGGCPRRRCVMFSASARSTSARTPTHTRVACSSKAR